MQFKRFVESVIEEHEEVIGKHSSEMFPWSIENATADVVDDEDLQEKFELLKREIIAQAIAALEEDKRVERLCRKYEKEAI